MILDEFLLSRKKEIYANQIHAGRFSFFDTFRKNIFT